MNEEVQAKLELLKVMKDLNGQGFRLNNEMTATIHSIIVDLNIISREKYEELKTNGNLPLDTNKFIKSVEKSLTGMGFKI